MINVYDDTDDDVLTSLEDQSTHEEERDRFFEPWRVPIDPKMTNLLSDIDDVLLTHEVLHIPRKRTRKKDDQAVFREVVSALVCDLTHCVLTGYTEGVVLSRSNSYLTA